MYKLENVELSTLAVSTTADPQLPIATVKQRSRELLSRCYSNISPVGTNVNWSNTFLPKATLPKFGGDCSQWNKFWQTFNAMVHKRTDLEPVIKFQYLIGSLVGEAAECIEGVETSENNYPLAI